MVNASKILTGPLKENNRGKLVSEKMLGKVLVQAVFS